MRTASEILYPRVPSAQARRRVEIISTGIDEALQTTGSSPYGSLSWTGLRVPTLATPPASPDLRYLFMLAQFSLSEGTRGRIVGLRHGWSLGISTAGPRIVEQWVQDPLFKLPDGNISWFLRKQTFNEPLVPNPGQIFDPLAGGDQQNLAFQFSRTPSLLFQTVATPTPFYVDLTAYTPPAAGRPWGTPIDGDLGMFFDLKTKWQDASDWHAIDAPVEGPCRICFYASVNQSDPATRAALATPVLANLFPQGLSPEEQFLRNYPTAIIWRVAGAIAVELDEPPEGDNANV